MYPREVGFSILHFHSLSRQRLEDHTLKTGRIQTPLNRKFLTNTSSYSSFVVQELSTMDQSTSHMENPTIITSEALMPVVNRYFGRFSAVQWNMLAAGIQDSNTIAILADLCTEVVQTLCTMVLRFLKPTMEVEFHSRESQADFCALEELSTHVGDSLSESFALALHVPPEKCESVEQLTELMEREVSNKVNSIVSEAINSPVWPSEPAVFVSGSMSDIRSLGQMVSHTAKCLRRYLDRMRFQCMGECWPLKLQSASYKRSESTQGMLEIEEPETCETPQDVKSKISVPFATKAVTDIFMKWSSNTPDVTQEGENAPPSDLFLDAQDAAAEIVETIVRDLHYENFENVAGCSEKSISPTPHFNVRLIFDQVREFFASQPTPSDNTSNANQAKRRFSSFAKKQYRKMIAELKSRFRRQDSEFLVSLKKKSRTSQLTLTEDECLIPGAISESPRLTPEGPSPTRMTKTRTKISKFPLQTIKVDVNSLFDKLHQTEDLPAQASKRLENIKASGEIRKFSKELVDKIYDHLMAGQTYQIPVVSIDRCLSDSVIPELSRKMDARFSPEVLYAMTEDAVEKFLQKVLLQQYQSWTGWEGQCALDISCSGRHISKEHQCFCFLTEVVHQQLDDTKSQLPIFTHRAARL